jgi:hypothetical protein
MGEEAVIADRQPKTRDEPHAEKQADLKSADGPVKQQDQRDQRTEKGQYIEDDEVPALHLVKVAASDNPIVAHFRTGNISRGKQCNIST